VACLYCGKEIGPLRLIRDSEFCSAQHRTEYRLRLRRVLTQVGEPETVSTGLAPFFDACQPQDGNPRSFVPSLSFRSAVRIPLSWPVRVARGGSGFTTLGLKGTDDASTFGQRPFSAEFYSGSEKKTPTPPPALLEAQLGRATPAISDSPAAIAPDSRTDALETSPANTWLAPCPPLQAPTELPPVRGVSTLREHPLASPISLSYSIAYRSSRSASYAEASLTQREQPAPVLLELTLNALPSEQIEEASRPVKSTAPCELFAAIPAAVPSASYVQASLSGPLSADSAIFVPRGPRLAPVTYPAPTNGTMPALAAAAVETFIQPLAAVALAGTVATPLIPQLTAQHGPRVFERPASGAWMPSLQSQPAARMVQPAEAATVQAFARRAIQLTAFSVELARTGQSMEQPALLAESFPVPAAVPVEAAPTARRHVPAAISAMPLHLASFQIAAIGGSPAPAAGFVPALAAIPVEAAATAPAHSPTAVAGKPGISLPQFALQPDLQRPACAPAGFERQTANAATPPKQVANRHAALSPLHSIEPLAPPLRTAAVAPAVPQCSALSLANQFIRVNGLPRHNPKSINRGLDLAMPRFGLRPVFERFETFVDLTKLERKRSGVFDITDYPQFRKHQPVIQHAGKAIAACLLVGVALWFGAHAANLGRRIVSRDATSELAALQNSARAASGAGQSGSTHFISPVVWAKGAIAKRAAVQLTDSFEQGMQAWGTTAKSWAPGWSRNPDGYVRPGQLALLQPTLAYTNYRLEFFGQIEKKGMSWAVRAHDPKNYYAMGFKVVEPGLRPIVAMVHYAVVGGKAGQSVQVPLSVMMHNDTAYHVAVQVTGRRYTASIEGQEVDSWTDDALPSGGVGFFSEAGERARLYWMKVYKNDDWLGRVCAFLSGSSVEDSQQTAWLERQQVPGPAPSRPVPAQSEAVLLAGETGEYSWGRPQRSASRAATQGRIRIWSS
jgi:hypothetical protein